MNNGSSVGANTSPTEGAEQTAGTRVGPPGGKSILEELFPTVDHGPSDVPPMLATSSNLPPGVEHLARERGVFSHVPEKVLSPILVSHALLGRYFYTVPQTM